MKPLFEGMLMADYHQFYVADAQAEPEAAPWTDDDLRQGLLVGDAMISVSTARNMPVPVSLAWHEARPEFALAGVDHAVEASFVTTGEILLAGCTDSLSDAARFTVQPGPLRLLLLCHGLGTLSEDGLEGEDRYALHLWPEAPQPVRVLQQWEEPGEPG